MRCCNQMFDCCSNRGLPNAPAPSRSSNETASSNPSPLRIGIIGAGIAGLTLANSFPEEQFPHIQVTIFERRSKIDAEEGGPFALQGGGEGNLEGGLRVLEALNITSKQLAELQQRVHSSVGGVAAAEGEDAASQPRVAHMRSTVVALLFAAAKSKSNVKMCLNTQVTVLTERSESRGNGVLVQYSSVGNQASKTSAFDVVFGADGNAPSSVSVKAVMGAEDSAAAPTQILSITAAVPAADSDVIEPQSEYLLDAQGNKAGRVTLENAVGTDQKRPGQYQLWACCELLIHVPDFLSQSCPWPAGRWEQQGQNIDEMWIAVLKHFTESSKDANLVAQCEAIVEQVSSGQGGRVHAWVPFVRPAISKIQSQKGQMVLLGDAAHLMPPTKGWGGNCAMDDAYNVALFVRALGPTWTSASLIAALTAYAKERTQAGGFIERCEEASYKESEELCAGQISCPLLMP